MFERDESVLGEVQELIEQLHGLLAQLTSKAGEELEQGEEQARRTVESVVERLRDLRRELARVAKKTEHIVHDHPWQTLAVAMAIAFAAGLALGTPIGRRTAR